MLIQFEQSARGANGGTSDSSRLNLRRWVRGNSLRNLYSATRSALLDVTTGIVWIGLAILFVCSGAAAIGGFAFLLLCKF